MATPNTANICPKSMFWHQNGRIKVSRPLGGAEKLGILRSIRPWGPRGRRRPFQAETGKTHFDIAARVRAHVCYSFPSLPARRGGGGWGQKNSNIWLWPRLPPYLGPDDLGTLTGDHGRTGREIPSFFCISHRSGDLNSTISSPENWFLTDFGAFGDGQ